MKELSTHYYHYSQHFYNWSQRSIPGYQSSVQIMTNHEISVLTSFGNKIVKLWNKNPTAATIDAATILCWWVLKIEQDFFSKQLASNNIVAQLIFKLLATYLAHKNGVRKHYFPDCLKMCNHKFASPSMWAKYITIIICKFLLLKSYVQSTDFCYLFDWITLLSYRFCFDFILFVPYLAKGSAKVEMRLLTPAILTHKRSRVFLPF